MMAFNIRMRDIYRTVGHKKKIFAAPIELFHINSAHFIVQLEDNIITVLHQELSVNLYVTVLGQVLYMIGTGQQLAAILNHCYFNECQVQVNFTLGQERRGEGLEEVVPWYPVFIFKCHI